MKALVTSEEMVDIIRADSKAYASQNKVPGNSSVKELYKEATDEFVKKLEKGEFLDDEAINRLANRIYQQIIKGNTSYSFPKRLLISRNTVPNAYYTHDGTIVLHLGLINRITSEDQLAFILAHESAHHILNHAAQKIRLIADPKLNRKSQKKVDKSDYFDRVEVFKSLIYDQYEYSRLYEQQADSLGIKLLENSGYDISGSFHVLNILDSADQAKYDNTLNLERIFNFSKYPFKLRWIAKEEEAFIADESKSFIYDNDSIKTHPGIPDRKQYLLRLYANLDTIPKPLDNTEIKMIYEISDLELIESAKVLDQYSLSLFYALKMISKSSDNGYLKTAIADILIKLYMARRDHKFNKYVPLPGHHQEQLSELVNFLNNLRMSEIGNIAFNYLNRDEVFNESNEYHYMMLWEISTLIGRADVAELVKTDYEKKYPDGEYHDKLSIN